MAEMDNKFVEQAIEGVAEAADKIDDKVLEPVKKGLSKAAVAVIAGVTGFTAGVAGKIGFDKVMEKKAQKDQIEDKQQEQPKAIEEFVEVPVDNFEENEQ